MSTLKDSRFKVQPVVVALRNVPERPPRPREDFGGLARQRAARIPREIVLLGGTIRPTLLQTSIERSLLDVPLRKGVSLLDQWAVRAREFAIALKLSKVHVRVVIDHSSHVPIALGNDMVEVGVVRDPQNYRGTGGVLRDLAEAHEADDLILVANATQVLDWPIATVVQQLADAAADVALTSNDDGTPGGLMLIRCGCLADVAAVGFVDFKEQALQSLARKHRVVVVRCGAPVGLPIRTPSDYIAALQRLHRTNSSIGLTRPAFAEDWRSSFAIVEEGASVHASARIHDSVVLKGGRVEANAVVVRSIVCPGGLVRRGRTFIDELVSGASK